MQMSSYRKDGCDGDPRPPDTNQSSPASLKVLSCDADCDMEISRVDASEQMKRPWETYENGIGFCFAGNSVLTNRDTK